MVWGTFVRWWGKTYSCSEVMVTHCNWSSSYTVECKPTVRWFWEREKITICLVPVDYILAGKGISGLWCCLSDGLSGCSGVSWDGAVTSAGMVHWTGMVQWRIYIYISPDPKWGSTMWAKPTVWKKKKTVLKNEITLCLWISCPA